VLQRLPFGAALRMRDVYKRWAEGHLDRDEECVACFCNFLTSDFGTPLRFDGLCWIANMLRGSARSGRWYRYSSGEALIELLNTSLKQNAKDLAKSGEARQAFVEIAADLVERNLPAALALQERIKMLR